MRKDKASSYPIMVAENKFLLFAGLFKEALSYSDYIPCSNGVNKDWLSFNEMEEPRVI